MDAQTPRQCCVMVSTTVSHVVGKRKCQQIPRYEYLGKHYCAKHQTQGQLEQCRSELATARNDLLEEIATEADKYPIGLTDFSRRIRAMKR